MNVTDKALTVGTGRPAPLPVPVSRPVFSCDAPEIGSMLAEARFLAELALLKEVETPLCVGLFGPAGSGKTSLLRATQQAVDALGRAAREAGLATPFTGSIAVVPVTFGPEADAAAILATAVGDKLAEMDPRLVDEVAHADPDPQATLEAARDRLDQLRQRLDTERRRVDELTSRQARLTETVLFEASGSQVDAYARTHRGRIERSLRGFGFGDDPLLAYKELVRDRVEPGFAAGGLPAFWAYRGQARLLVVAAGLFVLFWLIGLLIDNQGPLLGTLRDSNERLQPLADWLATHASLLEPVRELAGLAGLAALALNLVRGIRFNGLITRGARLLRGDVDARRRDLDGLVAHQAQRAETLARAVEEASVQTTAAESRVSQAGALRRSSVLPRAAHTPSHRAATAAFFAAIGAALARPRGDGAELPDRLILCLDGLERLPSREAAAALDTAHALLGRPGIVTVVALDRAHVAAGYSETDPALAAASLDRIVQVPLAVGSDADARELTRSLLASPRGATPTATDAAVSTFEKPWLPEEAAVVESLSGFAGTTPRAIKRFVNLYRIARAHPRMEQATVNDLGGLALGLAALAQGMVPGLAAELPADGSFDAMRRAASNALGAAIDTGRTLGLRVAERFSSF